MSRSKYVYTVSLDSPKESYAILAFFTVKHEAFTFCRRFLEQEAKGPEAYAMCISRHDTNVRSVHITVVGMLYAANGVINVQGADQ